MSNAPEPKRRFIPSKWEAKKVNIPSFTSVEMIQDRQITKLVFAHHSYAAMTLQVVKYVRAIREGLIRFDKPKEEDGPYLLWGDDSGSTEKTNHLAYIPAPKQKLPGKCDKLWSCKICHR